MQSVLVIINLLFPALLALFGKLLLHFTFTFLHCGGEPMLLSLPRHTTPVKETIGELYVMGLSFWLCECDSLI